MKAAQRKSIRWQVWLVVNALVAPEIRVLKNPFEGEKDPKGSLRPLGYEWRFKLGPVRSR